MRSSPSLFVWVGSEGLMAVGALVAGVVWLEPRSLERSLRELGWVIKVKPLAGPFFLGLGGRAG
jgi:hypothetical protein